MSKRITVSISEGNAEFLCEHPEISPSRLLQKSLDDYKRLVEEHRHKQEEIS